MCGITGFIDFNSNTPKEILDQMVLSLRHRGPDDEGAEVFQQEDLSVGLGQSRLSIIDLSEAGHQPMHFKQLSCVFNGEIYNYKEIRSELKELGHEFITGSDTEVILHSYEEWGLDSVEKFIGMFVFIVYDRENKTLTITRDRAGVKPLYYYQKDDLFLFGSELKALISHPKFERQINKSVLPTYLNYGYIPAPYSVFQDTYKLNPGHHLIIDLNSKSHKIQKYWDATDYYRKSKFDLSYDKAKSQLHDLLKSAFSYRMVSDVPVGVFLSGGYDSTAVASIIQSGSIDKINTFTIGFEEGNNEAPYAKETAEYIGSDHTEYYCTTKEAQDIIEDLPFYYDEPFGDSSAIPTILVSRLAKQKATVALSADGGDELFLGYAGYLTRNRNLNKLNFIPNHFKPELRKVMGPLVSYLPLSVEKKYKVESFFKALNKEKFEQAQKLFSLAYSKPSRYISGFLKHESECVIKPYEALNPKDFHEVLDVFLAVDYQNYLQNDILVKVDRATMSASLEGREPLLDHRLLEYAARLPIDYKYNQDRKGKRILKDIVHEYVPKEMMERPKAGFSIPVLKWLRGELSYLIDEYLSRDRLEKTNVFNVDFVLKEVTLFKSNKMHYSPIIWYILMFQMWYEKWIK